ncbi:hypothetical protein ACFE04_011166 [Oxalis oulophora]
MEKKPGMPLSLKVLSVFTGWFISRFELSASRNEGMYFCIKNPSSEPSKYGRSNKSPDLDLSRDLSLQESEYYKIGFQPDKAFAQLNKSATKSKQQNEPEASIPEILVV